MEDQKAASGTPAPPQFDVSKKFGIRIQSGGEKRCVVRFPTDREWCEHTRAQMTIRKILGRGRSVSDTSGSEQADAELFAAIHDDAAVEFDAIEAGGVLAKLQRADVDDVEREADSFRIRLKVMGGILTEHVLRMPTQKEIHDYNRSSTRLVNVRRSQEIRSYLEPSGDLYDKIASKSSGYAATVPIIHKAAAVSELLMQLNELDEDQESPEPQAP
jgi:hypothetical protein